jgi:hypothetical protein
MKTYGGVVVQIHVFLISALDGGEWSASRPGRLTPGREPGTHWIGGWVGLRGDLDDMEKRKFLSTSELELRPLGRPAYSQPLYRLPYPGSSYIFKFSEKFSEVVLRWSEFAFRFLSSMYTT